VSCTRTKHASKPRLGLPVVQHARRRPKQLGKTGGARSAVLGKGSGLASPQHSVGLSLSVPRPDLRHGNELPRVKTRRNAKPTPQPSKPTAQHPTRTKAHGSKLPAAAAGRSQGVDKGGKVARSTVGAKQGGTAKSAKHSLPKPSTGPTTAPARQARRRAPAKPPIRVRVSAGSPAPNLAAQPTSQVEPAAEDEDPGIGPAGSTAGGDHPSPAQVVVLKATVHASEHREDPLQVSPEARSPHSCPAAALHDTRRRDRLRCDRPPPRATSPRNATSTP